VVSFASKTKWLYCDFEPFVKQEVVVTACSRWTLFAGRNKSRCDGTGALSSILDMKSGGMIL
jgi:hypothetical protein